MIKRIDVTDAELSERLALNEKRLNESYYRLPEVFMPPEYDWPGDKEGRALLAFVSHYKATGHIIPAMPELLAEMPKRLNAHLFFGPEVSDVVFEQQLSGHSWLLRGLCEHYEQFRDEFSLRVLKSVTEYLYLPTAGRYRDYPVDRSEKVDGGVSGHTSGVLSGWRISSDVGCAFMCIDGLSHVYKLTRDSRVKELIDEQIQVYSAIDKVKLKAQTHCTLTAARGMLRMYTVTENPQYLVCARDIFNLYVFGKGMDAAFQNLNWWGRPNTWTEPCAIVDSLMLAGELYRITGKDMYRRFAARVWHNGLASSQRPNGGAGTDSVVFIDVEGLEDVPELSAQMYEAPFCCTMRLAEGLWYANENREMLYCEAEYSRAGEMMTTHDRFGRYMCGDLVLAEPSLPAGTDAEGWMLPAPTVTVDGHALSPLVKYYKANDNVVRALKQRVLFR